VIPVPLSGILDTETGLKDKRQTLYNFTIGSDEGFVDGGLLLFEGSKGGDYHQEMNAIILKTLPNNAMPHIIVTKLKKFQQPHEERVMLRTGWLPRTLPLNQQC
jgi:hypothetical protein